MIELGTKAVRKIIDNDQKYKDKIENKDFLMGKFEENLKKKLARKAKKPKKMEKSKFFEIMTKQYRASETKNLNYCNFLQLNKVWNQYIADLIQAENNPNDLLLKIIRADFHGSLLQVLESKVRSYEGLRGIVIRETLRTFVMVTPEDRIVTVLKQNSLFLLVTDSRMFKVYGCNLVYRSADRAKHKFKAKAASEFILSTDMGSEGYNGGPV